MQNSQLGSTPPTRSPESPISELFRDLPLLIAERERRQEELLDAALEETFPASDPVSVMRLT
jgi:hypothetical protein